MSLVDRTGQVWRTRTCFRTMYHPSGINKLARYSYYVILHSKTCWFDDHDVTHHSIAITRHDGEVWLSTILEKDSKPLEQRFEFMGKRVE